VIEKAPYLRPVAGRATICRKTKDLFRATSSRIERRCFFSRTRKFKVAFGGLQLDAGSSNPNPGGEALYGGQAGPDAYGLAVRAYRHGRPAFPTRRVTLNARAMPVSVSSATNGQKKARSGRNQSGLSCFDYALQAVFYAIPNEIVQVISPQQTPDEARRTLHESLHTPWPPKVRPCLQHAYRLAHAFR